jgi:hypothetical protein
MKYLAPSYAVGSNLTVTPVQVGGDFLEKWGSKVEPNDTVEP